MEPNSSKHLRSLATNELNAKIDYGITRDLRSDIIELKSALKQIQKEQLSSAAALGTVDDVLKEIWIKIRGFDSTLPTLAVVSSLDLLKQDFTTSLDKLQKLMDENQETFRSTFGLSVDTKLDQIYAWFHKVEDSLKTKQQRLYSQLDSLAQECDLAALRENVRDDFIHFQKRLDQLDKGLEMQYDMIKTIKGQNALKIIVSAVSHKKDLSIKLSWKKWQHLVLSCRRVEENESIKAKTMRKLILRTCFGRKERAWQIWYDLVQDHKSVEKRRTEASAVVLRTLQRSSIVPIKAAFRRWHRVSIWTRRMASFDLPEGDSVLYQQPYSEQARRIDLESLEYSMRFKIAMCSLKNDHEGAMLILTKELCNIRSLDLMQCRQEMRARNESLHNRLLSGIESLQKDFQNSFLQLDETLLKDSLKINQEISEVKDLIQGIENRLSRTIHDTEKISILHAQQIQSTISIVDSLAAKAKVVDEHLGRIDDSLNIMDIQSRQLQMTNLNLVEKLRKNEEVTNRMKADFQSQISQLQSKVGDLLRQSNDHSTMLQSTVDSLDSMKMDQMHLKIDMDERFDGLTKSMNEYGVRKPNMTMIIQEGLSYEALSKERNYSVTLSRINIGDDEIDLAGDIASFAHDYASWITFQVDHEVLQSIIVGQNPEDLVYANDESSEKRTFLLKKLKTRLETALEEAYPSAGAQRIEARTKFISRVIEATEAALSKYDQVLVPISARLAKVRASVPTCMACDRPLRVKERNALSLAAVKAGSNSSTSSIGLGSARNMVSASGKSDRDNHIAESMESKAQTLHCILASANSTTNTSQSSENFLDSTNYVMRGGFKMPLVHRAPTG